jgi:hypothetical protein
MRPFTGSVRTFCFSAIALTYRRQPFRHRGRIEESPVNSFGGSAQHAVKTDSVVSHG